MKEKTEVITLTGLPFELIPPDTPTFLTDRTWIDILNNLQVGIPLTKTLSKLGCEPNVAGKVVQWIYKDSVRKNLYLDALELQAEILSQEILDISDGVYDANPGSDMVSPPEDLKRSALRIKARMWLIEKNNKRFTPRSINELTVVDLNKAMELAEKNIKTPKNITVEGEPL